MEITVNGCNIYYDVAGDGPPLLIPGWASTKLFETNLSLFGDDYTVISFDVRGTGCKTIPPAGPYTVADIADDAAAVVKTLDYERVHYLGLSHTGVIGQVMAIRHPELIERLALTMTTPGSQANTSDTNDKSAGQDISEDLSISSELSESMAAALAGDRNALRRNAELGLSPDFARDHPEVVEHMVEEIYMPIFSQPREDIFRFWSALTNVPSASRLNEIKSQTLIVAGSEDRMVELSDSWRMWQEIPNAIMVGLNGIGHDWYMEAPELVSSVVKSFLRGELDTKRNPN